MTPREFIYLDHAATTPLDPRVLDEMLPFLRDDYGNAASPHALGRRAADAVEHARGEVALALGADPREIVFTSGATEANNLALKGVAGAPAHARAPRRVITAVTEHHAVLDPLAGLARPDAPGGPCEVVRLAVDGEGHIDLAELERELRRGALLVSLMSANNELGVLHPLTEIGALCRAHGALFHTDATQSFGRGLPAVDAAHIDLLSLSAHKVYGPKGVGALYLRRKRPRVRVSEQLEGGGHEAGRRSGTLNVPAIVGLGAAARLALLEWPREGARIAALRDTFEAELLAQIHGAVRNGDAVHRLAGHSNLSFPDVDAESLLRRMPTLCASTAAACTSASHRMSHVLGALGLPAERVRGSVRFSLGRDTTSVHVAEASACIVDAVARERNEGPRSDC